MAGANIASRTSLSWFLLSCSLFIGAWAIEEEALPGWRGESHTVGQHAAAASGRNDAVGAHARPRDTGIDPTKVVQVSWEPRVFVYKNLLTPEECDHVVALAKPSVTRSYVADNDSGESKLSDIRTSSGTFLNKRHDDIVARIEERIAHWTFLPAENGENIQVLQYNLGQKYDAHFDYFHDKVNSALGGHRYATVLMYLTDVEEGGETVFPNSRRPPDAPTEGFSQCALQGISVKPRKGDALLFYSLHIDGTTDEHSLHAGCPVIKGEKWSATKWIHVASFEQRAPSRGCEDQHPNCAEWAAMGECEKNPVYMVGDGTGSNGACRKACKKC